MIRETAAEGAIQVKPPHDPMSNKATKMTPERVQECRLVRELLDAEKKRSGLTQKTLALMINRSPKLISAICNERSAVTVNVGRALARVFGVPLSQILPWTAALKDSKDAAKYADVIDDLNDMSEENRRAALRMIRSLADSQE